MKKNKKRGKEKDFKPYTPMSMTKALISMGESCSKTEMALWYVGILVLAIILGLLFGLSWKMIAVVAIVYIILTPKLIYNMKKRTYEKKRFDDANAYLSQMAQSFTSTGNILASLIETRDTFTQGKMRSCIEGAIDKIENSYINIRQSEAEALEIIEKSYSCEKIRNLHDFLVKAESRGGECASEFKILEKIRLAWSDAVLKYNGTLVSNRNMVMILYGLLLLVCVVFLRRFPDDIDIMSITAVRITNALELVAFLLVFIFMDSKLNGSLLKGAKVMSEESAEKYHEYVDNYSAKAEMKKNLPLIIISTVMCILVSILRPKVSTFVIVSLFLAFIYSMHRIMLYLTISSIKTEVRKTFPKWLFDIMLLIQSESVESALFHSLELAPPVLRPEIRKMCESLRKKPGNPDAYMSFLASYHIPGVEDTMRKLYSLSVGTGDKAVMEVIIDSNMTSLSDAEKKSLNTKGQLASIYTYIPLALVSVALLVYCGMLIAHVFVQLYDMLGTAGL